MSSSGGLSSASSSSTSSVTSFLRGLSNLGLGYAIAIALGLLVLLSTLLLTSYICCRASSRRRQIRSSTSDPTEGIVLPRIIFVAEDDEEDEGRQNGLSASTAVGLDPIAISSYPKFQFSSPLEKGKGERDGACAICLCEYREGEMLRMMPDCGHYFHLMCIDAWLRLNASCPVCRNSPMPTPQSTPLSTPLSELVPLSQFAGGRRLSKISFCAQLPKHKSLSLQLLCIHLISHEIWCGQSGSSSSPTNIPTFRPPTLREGCKLRYIS